MKLHDSVFMGYLFDSCNKEDGGLVEPFRIIVDMEAQTKAVLLKGGNLPAARFFGGVYSVRRKIATGTAGFLVLALGYHVVFGHNGLIIHRQKRMDARTLDGEIRMLNAENERTKAHVDRLQSDPNAIEHEARNVLHYTRPGEVVIMLPASQTTK